jgi:hypothetical protein
LIFSLGHINLLQTIFELGVSGMFADYNLMLLHHLLCPERYQTVLAMWNRSEFAYSQLIHGFYNKMVFFLVRPVKRIVSPGTIGKIVTKIPEERDNHNSRA